MKYDNDNENCEIHYMQLFGVKLVKTLRLILFTDIAIKFNLQLYIFFEQVF